jgi:hypothetical protein
MPSYVYVVRPEQKKKCAPCFRIECVVDSALVDEHTMHVEQDDSHQLGRISIVFVSLLMLWFWADVDCYLEIIIVTPNRYL